MPTDCPPDALRRKPSGEVYILDNCIGCGNCSSFCPYGVIQMAAVDEKYMAEQKAIREGRAKPSTGSVGKIPGTLWNLLFGGRQSAAKADKKMAVKCDLCTNLPAKRGQHRAACVASCPTGAILRVSPKDYVDSVMAAED